MTHTNQPSLEDVLDMMLVTYGEPTPQAIADFAERYPAYRSELFNFAADWAENEVLPEPAPLSAEDRTRALARAQSLFQNIAFQQGQGDVAEQVTTRVSLTQLAKRAGKTLDDVRQALGFDLGLIAKLNSRSLKPDTIPAWVSRVAGNLLSVSEQQIRASWTGPPLALSKSFHARKAPIIPHKEDFEIAVASSTLSPEEKAALLSDR